MVAQTGLVEQERQGVGGSSRAREIRAAGGLAADGIGGLTNLAERMHKAISDRAFGATGPLGAPVRAVHDGLAGSTYRALRGLTGAAARAAAAGAARLGAEGSPAPSRSPRGGMALGALNGVMGDRLEEEGNELAVSMTLRHGGEDVRVEASAIAEAFPEAGPRIALFVHGLCETDAAWRLHAERHYDDRHATHGARLERDLGHTPVYVRYNSGRHVSDNGRDLSDLLEDLVAAWPVPVEELVLIGHSMGGLVARSACHQGHGSGRGWTRSVRHVISLGAPHLGAPLEKATNLAGWALTAVAETRPFAIVLNSRSLGIKDLRYGSLVEEDWQGHDADELLSDRCQSIPLLESADHYFIGATLSQDAEGLIGRLAGDLLVRFGSASGKGRPERTIPFEEDNGRHLGGLNHFDLLNHPLVYEQIRGWLERARGATATGRLAAPAPQLLAGSGS